MKGKKVFTQYEFDGIKNELKNKVLASPSQQKGIRKRIRDKFNFYISDFNLSSDGFGTQDLDDLLKQKLISIRDTEKNESEEEANEEHIPSKTDNTPRLLQPVVNLEPYLDYNLDLLFVALNPPVQSNNNGHYFSGKSSSFFKLLYESGLLTQEVDKSNADTLVFNGREFNYLNKRFGVVDLKENIVETNSNKVKTRMDDSDRLIDRIDKYKPRIVCVIHSKVRDTLNNNPRVTTSLKYGCCGKALSKSESIFYVNHFPNGNSIPKEPKLELFRQIREKL